MFETFSSFLWAFFIGFGLIILGIIFEEKLIAFEDKIFRFAKAVVIGVKMTISERRHAHGQANQA